MDDNDRQPLLIMNEAESDEDEPIVQEAFIEEEREEDHDMEDVGAEGVDDDSDSGDEWDDGDNDEEEEEMAFHLACFRLSSNFSDMTKYKTPPLTDVEAILLGYALSGNEYLKTLDIKMARTMTMDGAQDLASGMVRSKIETLSLSVEEEGIEAPIDAGWCLFAAAVKTVTDLTPSFLLTEADAVKMKEALLTRTHNALRSLSFHVTYLNPMTARILAPGIQGSQLQQFDMTGSNLDHYPDVMRELYLQGIQNSAVDDISLFGGLGDIHAFVTILPPMRSITIAFHYHLSTTDIRTLVNGLRQTHQLEYLEFCNCPLSDEHVRILINGIYGSDVSNGSLMVDDMAGLERQLPPSMRPRQNGSIFYLCLERSDSCGPIGAQCIVQATCTLSALKKLDLSANPLIGYEGLRLIGDALANSKLTLLTLSDVATWIKYDDVNCELAKEQERKYNDAARALVAGVRNSVHLLELNLDRVKLPTKAVAEIKFYLDMNRRCGRYLLPMQHSLPPAVWSLLLAKFNKELSVLFFYLNELPLLASGRDDALAKVATS